VTRAAPTQPTWAACTSPASVVAPADGAYLFQARLAPAAAATTGRRRLAQAASAAADLLAGALAGSTSASTSSGGGGGRSLAQAAAAADTNAAMQVVVDTTPPKLNITNAPAPLQSSPSVVRLRAWPAACCWHRRQYRLLAGARCCSWGCGARACADAGAGTGPGRAAGRSR
jgi:hypothetical protein